MVIHDHSIPGRCDRFLTVYRGLATVLAMLEQLGSPLPNLFRVSRSTTRKTQIFITFGILCGPTITKSPHLDEGSSLYPNLPCLGEFCLDWGNSGFWSCERFLYMATPHNKKLLLYREVNIFWLQILDLKK